MTFAEVFGEPHLNLAVRRSDPMGEDFICLIERQFGQIKMNQNPVFLLLGSNLGDRPTTLSQAQHLIEERIAPVVKASKLYETAPWGVAEQPAFLNQVLQLNTHWHPIDILERILKIEQELGRERRERWGARVIDIDILYYGALVMQMSHLVIPHPRLHERRFTLVPLAEIAADFLHPKLKKNTEELLNECTDNGEVNVFSYQQ